MASFASVVREVLGAEAADAINPGLVRVDGTPAFLAAGRGVLAEAELALGVAHGLPPYGGGGTQRIAVRTKTSVETMDAKSR